MKSRLLTHLAAVILLALPQMARADTGLTFQDFYDALAPDGDWVELEEYGYCWRPFVDDHWRPYTDGQWVYTEAGYTWFSNEPWGWATYHYGRWTKVKSWGWVWVLGYEWGPAWVSWRTNDDYIGWAALPPEAAWEPSTGFSVYVDIDYGIGPDWYAFCPVTYFCAPRLRTVCLPWRNNTAIINKTSNVTRICHLNEGMIFNDGPDINLINRRAETPLRRARLERETNFDAAALRERRMKSRLEGDTLTLPAPRVEKREGRPAAISGRAGKNQINRGWEGATKDPEQAKAYREKMRSEAERSGRKPHAVFAAPPQDVPAENAPQAGAARKPVENSVPPPTGGPAVDGSPEKPAPQNRSRDLQDQPPGPADNQRQQREEELRNRILEQRRQEVEQGEQRRQRQPQSPPRQQEAQPQQQEAAETVRQQQENEDRDGIRAQQDAEARRAAAQQKRQEQQDAARQQEQMQQQQLKQQQQEAAETARRQQAEESREKALRAQQEHEARRETNRQRQQQEQQRQQQQQELQQQLQQQMQQQRQQQRLDRRQGN